jgi:NAD-dependent deacetylase
MTDAIATAAAYLRRADRVCVLTGAGVSAESGVPTFRASDGLWEGHSIEDVASPEGWRRDPQLVWNFYHGRRAKAGSVRPNPGHDILAAIEARFGDRFTLATQNVDDLHQRAGSRNVLELHGSIRRTRCTECGSVADRGLNALPAMPLCECGYPVRPDIVWFGEMLPQGVWAKAEAAARSCDLFLVVGTSAVVYPAAGLVRTAKAQRTPAAVIEFNLAETDASAHADVGVYGPSGVTLPQVLAATGWVTTPAAP